MNKIYKVIWNKTRGMYMVVSELAKSQSKGSGSVDKRRKLTQSAAALALFFSIVSAGGTAWAANSLTIGTAEVKDTSGTEVKALTVEQGDATTIGTTLQQVETNKQDITTLQSSVEDAKKYTYRKVDAEEKAREKADTELNERITNEANDIHTEINAGDTALNERITAVKESLQADASVQDGTVVKAGSTIGKNVQDLDTALAVETAARIGADKAQDAVIQQVNQNASQGIATLATAYNNEVATRETADTALGNRATALENKTEAITYDKDTNTMQIDTRLTAAQGVYDSTTEEKGNYIEADKTVGENLNALDTQVKANADAVATKASQADLDDVRDQAKDLDNRISAEATARENGDKALSEQITNEANAIHETTNKLQSDLNTETTERKAADNELNERITNEANAIHDEIKAGDTALDNRITAVKESLQQEAADTYVSKDDASVQDGAVVKAANKVGKNVQALDTALAKETAARIGADKAQDAVIAQVNQNMVDGFNTINTNMSNGFAALNAADAAEKEARIGADTKLAEAVNNGLSLSEDNVLQKNTTTVADDGTVTTSKTDANEMILNKGKDNQITMNESGIKVGTNSTVIDKDGVYTGGDNYSEAKAAMKSDGSIKGADGKFTVNSANGTVNVNDQIELNGATGVVKSNGLNVGDGNFKVNSNGGVTAAGGKTTLASDGSIKAADGKFTVNSNGGVKAADGKITLSSDGSIKAADGKFTVNSNGAVKAADGKFTVDSNGAVKAANGNTTIDSNGNIKTVGTLSAADGSFKVDSTGKITSTGLDAGNGTIQTTGTVKAGTVEAGTVNTGDLNVTGKATVKDLDVTGEFNAKTLNSKVDANNYTTITGGNVTSKNLKMSDDGEIQASSSTFNEAGSTVWARDDESKGTSTVTADSVKQSISDVGDNVKNYASRELHQNSANKYEITDSVVEDKNSNVTNKTAAQSESTISDGTDTNKSTFRQKIDQILQEIKSANGSTSVEQTDVNITNTAANGTITNDAKALVNKASDSITSQIGDGSAVKSVMDANGIANTATGGTISNSAADVINTGTNSVINQVGDNQVAVKTDSVKAAYGSDTSTTWDAKGITNTTSGDISNSAANISNTTTGNMTNNVGGNLINTIMGDSTTTVTGKVTEDYKSDLSTKVGGNETHAVTGNQTTTVSGNRTVNVKGTETENFNAQITNIKTNQKTSVGGNQTNIVGGDQQNTVSGSKTETVKGSVTEKYGSQSTTVNGDQSTHVGGNQENVVAGNQTNTISGSKTETVKGAVNETYGSQTTKVNGDQSTTVAGKQTNSITGDQINTIGGSQSTTVTGNSSLSAKNITNTATEKLSNSAAEIENSASTSILNKVGDNVSSKMEADKITTEVKDGSKSNTVTDRASTSEQQLVSGNIIDILKDAENGYVNTTVQNSDGSSGTGVKQTTTDITNTAKQGTITNEAKNLVNTATEKLSNRAAEIENTATTSIKDIVGKSTVTTTDSGTTFENTDHAAAIGEGTITKTTISGNTVETGQVTTDYATVNKDLEVKGNTKLDGTLEVAGKSTFKDDVTMEKNLTVNGTTTTEQLVVNNGATIKGGASITGGTTTDTLHVTGTSTFDGMATFKDAVSMEKDLSVGGNATVAGDVSAKSYKVADKTYIDSNGINANSQKVTNVADGDVSEGSTDAVNGGQLHATNQRVSTVENRMDGVENRVDRVENRVDNLDNRIDKVGASAAAMANLHPMDFDEDSKLSVAAAVGTYRSETAGALGVFYRPSDRVMMNVSTSFGNGENMVGGGVSFKLGKSSKRLQQAEATNAALSKQVTNLQNRLDALLGVLNPNLSKAFPDVPANHWAYEAVSRLAGNDIIQGYEDGKYHGERTMTRYEMAEIIYNALSKGAKAEAKLVEEFRPELQAMAAQRKA